MAGEYLPGNVRERIQELLKERKITQGQLASRIGSTESAVRAASFSGLPRRWTKA